MEDNTLFADLVSCDQRVTRKSDHKLFLLKNLILTQFFTLIHLVKFINDLK
jgi:hypothetical protein